MVADEGRVPPAPIGFSVRNRGRGRWRSSASTISRNRGAIQAVFVSLVEGNDLLVVDVNPATFIDSSFLAALVLADKRAAERARGPGSGSERHRSRARCSRSAASSHLACASDSEEAEARGDFGLHAAFRVAGSSNGMVRRDAVLLRGASACWGPSGGGRTRLGLAARLPDRHALTEGEGRLDLGVGVAPASVMPRRLSSGAAA